MRAKAKTLELQLLGWSRTNNGGSKVTFQIHDDDLEWFESMTVRKGKIAGQIIMGALVEVDAEGKPVKPAQETEKETPEAGKGEQPKKRGGFAESVGPLARLAVQWCADAKFQQWVGNTFPAEWAMSMVDGKPAETTKNVICDACQVLSRKELDENDEAAAEFNRLFREPYKKHLEETCQ